MRAVRFFILISSIVAAPIAGAGTSLGLSIARETGEREMDIAIPGYGELKETGDIDGGGFTALLGFGDIGESRFEVELSSYQVGNDAEFSEEREISAALGFLAVASVDSNIKPFLHFGLGAGRAELDAESQEILGSEYMRNIFWSLGAGALLPISDRASINAKLSYISRTWNDIEYLGATMEVSDSAIRVGVGIDLYF